MATALKCLLSPPTLQSSLIASLVAWGPTWERETLRSNWSCWTGRSKEYISSVTDTHKVSSQADCSIDIHCVNGLLLAPQSNPVSQLRLMFAPESCLMKLYTATGYFKISNSAPWSSMRSVSVPSDSLSKETFKSAISCSRTDFKFASLSRCSLYIAQYM